MNAKATKTRKPGFKNSAAAVRPKQTKPDTGTQAAPKTGKDPAADAPADILARTIYGEARGELVRGKEAVASVVMNRVRRARERGGNYWWGGDVTGVCLKPWQFSCWNENDPNRPRIEAVTKDNRNFQSCLRIARRAIAGTLKDPTHGATHYHEKSLAPPWAKDRKPSAEIGNHKFYNNVE